MNSSNRNWLERAQEIYLRRQKERTERDGTIRRIVLFRDGKVARDTAERDWQDILYNIPIPPCYYNKQSRLLFCYNNGYANVMIPRILLEDKLKAKGVKSNGFKNEPGLVLMNAFVCRKDDYLVIFSSNAEGIRMVKARCLNERSYNEAMNAKGYIFVKDARPYKWMVVPKELRPILLPIIRHDSSPGIELVKYGHAHLLEEIMAFAAELNPAPIIREFPK